MTSLINKFPLGVNNQKERGGGRQHIQVVEETLKNEQKSNEVK